MERRSFWVPGRKFELRFQQSGASLAETVNEWDGAE